MTKLVIIGTGLAGYTLAREFRRRDEKSEILLITRDDGSSYSKPMLSNALSKEKQADDLVMADIDKMSENLRAEIWAITTVLSIDANAHSLETDKGVVNYDKLVLANGANTISVSFEGDAAEQVLSVNDLADYRKFRSELEKGKRIVIVGAGMIGCEFANDLLNVNAQISIVDLSPHVLNFLLPQQASILLQEKLAQHGVEWHLQNSVTHIENTEAGLVVTLNSGHKINADIVLSAIGLRPSIELAIAAGLATDRGVKVDRYLRTSHEDIFALGDCAQVDDLTLPFVMPLMTSARALAATLAGEETAVNYPAMPVALKTPCYPVVVCPAPRRINGRWEIDVNEQGLRALYKDSNNNIAGFALTDERVSEKTALSKEIADWLV